MSEERTPVYREDLFNAVGVLILGGATIVFTQWTLSLSPPDNIGVPVTLVLWFLMGTIVGPLVKKQYEEERGV